jgi:protein-tyrosine phosphatase
MVETHLHILPGIDDGPETVEGSLALEVFTQLTASSLIGIWGKTIQRCAEIMLKKGMIHSITSDAHAPGRRTLAIKQSLDIAIHMLGQSEAQQLNEGRPGAIVQHEVVGVGSTRQFRQKRGM